MRAAVSRWDGVSLHPSTVRMTGLAPAAKNYLARNELVTGLGIGDYWIDRMTREGKLELVVRKNGKSSYHLYKREEAERLRDYLEGLIETPAATLFLICSQGGRWLATAGRASGVRGW